ncbi:MAG: hypothetical protein KC561_10615 [Myxococcales bacterium]|nr:hypothetical protein [Myxococcales bacterium]
MTSTKTKRSTAIFAVLLILLAGPVGALAQGAIDSTEGPTAQDQAIEESVETAEELVEENESEEDAEEDDGPDIGAPLGLTILSVGSLVGGIGYLVVAGADEDDAASAPADRAAELQDRADTERAVGITMTTLGVLFAAGATYLWIDALAGDNDDDAVSFAPTFGPHGAGFSLSGSF